MKKILTVLLTAAMFICGPANGLFAEEQVLNNANDSAEEITGEIELEAIIASTYYVQLPKKVNVANKETTINIYARGDVDGDKELVILEDKTTDVTHSLVDEGGKNSDVLLTITSGAAIKGKDIKTNEYDLTKGTTMLITHGDINAGKWTCDLPIIIKLQTLTA